jgi:DNA-binding NtrC family response regulator
MNDSVYPRVLIIEDEPDIAGSIMKLLTRRLNASADIAPDAHAAMESVDSHVYDLVTLDFQLPDKDGLQVLAHIMKKPSPPPVVMVTGHGDEELAAEALKMGAADYVRKDNRLADTLLEAARKALSDSKLKKDAVIEKSHGDLFSHWKPGLAPADLQTRVLDVNPE